MRYRASLADEFGGRGADGGCQPESLPIPGLRLVELREGYEGSGLSAQAEQVPSATSSHESMLAPELTAAGTATKSKERTTQAEQAPSATSRYEVMVAPEQTASSEEHGTGCQILGDSNVQSHSVRDHVNDHSTEVAEVEVFASSLQPGALLVASIRVDGKDAEAFFDSGATATLIRQNLAPAELSPSAITVAGLGASRVSAVGSTEVSMGLGQLNLSASCLVVPDQSIGYDIILGEDFLLRYKVKLDLLSRCVQGTCQGGQFEVYLPLQPGSATLTVVRALPVYLINDLMAQQGQVELSKISLAAGPGISEGSGFLFEPEHDGLPALVYPECGVIDLAGGMASVLIDAAGGASHRVFVRRGTKVGTLSSIVEVEVPQASVSCMTTTVDQEHEYVSVDGGVERMISDLPLTGLEPEQVEQVREVLSRGKSAVSSGDEDIGCAGVTSHRIELHDTTPIRQKPRSFPDPVADEIERQCDELRDIGVIEYSKSAFSSPV